MTKTSKRAQHGASTPDHVKHLQVREAITEAIRSGEFSPGERLLGERELASRFGVSYMTARRAVIEMVDADLLERRSNEGTYVRAHTHRRLATVTINLIYEPTRDTVVDQFVQYAMECLDKRGWGHHVVHLQTERERPAIRALETGEPAIVMAPHSGLDDLLKSAMQKAGGRAVLVGNRLDNMGVPSVMADDAQAIRLLVGHLQGAGHRAIGIVSSHPKHGVVQIATWREACAPHSSPAQLEDRLIRVRSPHYGALMHSTYATMRDYLQSPQVDVTALICLGAEMTLATMAACHSIGKPVPHKISVVNSGDSPLLEFSYPPVTCIDVHLERHVELALQQIETALENRPASQLLHLIAPSLVIRGSVAAPSIS